MEMVNIQINGRDYSVPAGSTVIDAARIAKIDIPTLCYLKGVAVTVMVSSVSAW